MALPTTLHHWASTQPHDCIINTPFDALSTPTPPDSDVDGPTMTLPHQAPGKNTRFPSPQTEPILPSSKNRADAEDPCQLINISLESFPHPPTQPQAVQSRDRLVGSTLVSHFHQAHPAKRSAGNELVTLHRDQRATSHCNGIQGSINDHDPQLFLSSVAHHGESLRNWVPISTESKNTIISASTRTETRERNPNVNALTRPHNLPDWAAIGVPFGMLATHSPTSHPSSHIRQELETSLLRLLDRNMFMRFLRSELARDEFRRWMAKNEPNDDTQQNGDRKCCGVRKLDRWVDECKTDEIVDKLRTQCEAVFALYYHNNSDGYVPDSPQEINDTSLHTLVGLASAMSELRLSRSQEWLLQSLYESEFQQFVTSKLVQQTRIKLGRDLSKDERSGLGDSFCLCNPRLPDNPIVMVSPGFVAVTGYQKEEIMGRNCRFLQGPRTTSTSIERIRRALRTGKSCVELLLNYRRDGSPFYCLLNIIPLFDESASVTYFIGGQVNVTGNLESSQELFSVVLDNSLTAATNNNGPLAVPNFSREAPREPQMSDSPLMRNFMHGDPLEVFAPVISPGDLQISDGSEASIHPRVKVAFNEPHGKMLHLKDWLGRISGRLLLRRNQELVGDRLGEKPGVSISAGAAAGGADSFGNMALPLEQQFEAFESTYSRLLIFKKPHFEIVFATPRALEFLGFPTSTRLQVYCSKLLRSDFLQLISGTTSKESNLLRKGITDAVKQGVPVTCECFLHYGIHKFTNGDFGLPAFYHFRDSKKSKVHLTPLTDSAGDTSAYIVMLS